MSRIEVPDHPRLVNSSLAAHSTVARVSAACCARRGERYDRACVPIADPPPLLPGFYTDIPFIAGLFQ